MSREYANPSVRRCMILSPADKSFCEFGDSIRHVSQRALEPARKAFRLRRLRVISLAVGRISPALGSGEGGLTSAHGCFRPELSPIQDHHSRCIGWTRAPAAVPGSTGQSSFGQLKGVLPQRLPIPRLPAPFHAFPSRPETAPARLARLLVGRIILF